MVRAGNKDKHISISGGSYNLRSGARQAGQGSTTVNASNTILLARKTAISPVTEVYNSVLGSLTKRKSTNPGTFQTPAASLDRPADSSTPATELPRMDARSENVHSRPSDIPMPTLASHVSRRLSHKTSTSSGASADVTVIGQPLKMTSMWMSRICMVPASSSKAKMSCHV